MRVWITVLIVVTPLLDYFFMSGLSTSFRVSWFVISLAGLIVYKHRAAALALALLAGLAADLIGPGSTFGLGVIIYLLSYYATEYLVRSFGASWRLTTIAGLVLVSALIFYLMQNMAEIIFGFILTAAGGPRAGDILSSLAAALSTSVVAWLVFGLGRYGRQLGRRWLLIN